MEIIIEEISRGKKLIGRHKFATSQIQIGRGYDNDIILSDPHVCANHLNLECIDGQWFIKDLESLNGSRMGSKKVLIKQQPIHSGDIVTIGKSQLRFMMPDHPVVSSVKFNVIENIVEYLGRWPIILLMLSVFTVLNIMMMYLNSPSKEINYNSLVLWGLTLTLGYTIWPLICSLMSHLNKHEVRIGNQIGATFVIINLFWLVDFVEAFFGFNLSSNWSLNWFLLALSFALAFTMFWLNFYIAFEQSRQRRIKIALGLTTFIYGSLFLYDLSNEPEFRTFPVYNSTIMSPAFLIAKPSTPAEFINNSTDLFEVVEQQAKEIED